VGVQLNFLSFPSNSVIGLVIFDELPIICY
jgi:hypothetical protein